MIVLVWNSLNLSTPTSNWALDIIDDWLSPIDFDISIALPVEWNINDNGLSLQEEEKKTQL